MARNEMNGSGYRYTGHDHGASPAFAWIAAPVWVLGAVILLLPACSSTREVTNSPRHAIEQLLISQAMERTFNGFSIPAVKGAPVMIEVEGTSPDLAIAKALLREELGRQGAQVLDQRERAQYVVKLVVHSIGTEEASTLVGMPGTSGGLLPIALPELALYKVIRQKGYARYSLSIFELGTGKMIHTMPWRAGSAYYNYFTVFFLFSFTATDLVLPPIPDTMAETITVITPESTREEKGGGTSHQVSPGPL